MVAVAVGVCFVFLVFVVMVWGWGWGSFKSPQNVGLTISFQNEENIRMFYLMMHSTHFT